MLTVVVQIANSAHIGSRQAINTDTAEHPQSAAKLRSGHWGIALGRQRHDLECDPVTGCSQRYGLCYERIQGQCIAGYTLVILQYKDVGIPRN